MSFRTLVAPSAHQLHRSAHRQPLPRRLPLLYAPSSTSSSSQVIPPSSPIGSGNKGVVSVLGVAETAGETVRLSFNGVDNSYGADITVVVKPGLSMSTDAINAVINFGRSASTYDLGIDCDPARRSSITATWDGGALPAGVTFDGDNLIFANPITTVDNVAHTLTITLGSTTISRTVNVYEAAYLVARSKTNGVDKASIGNGTRVTYHNELVVNFYYSARRNSTMTRCKQ